MCLFVFSPRDRCGYEGDKGLVIEWELERNGITLMTNENR